MDWDALLQPLLKLVGNDPTLVLLLTVGFCFLKAIWPQPQPASTQVLNGFVERIRAALLAGDVESAKRLSAEGVDKAAGYLVKEAEPKPKGILDIFAGIFGNGTLMPLLLIGGLFLLLMLTNGGGCKKASSPPPNPSPVTPFPGVTGNAFRPAVFYDLDSASGLLCPVARQQGLPVDTAAWPWAWAGPETGLPVDCGGVEVAYAGDGGNPDQPGVKAVACAAGAPAACRGSACNGPGRQPALRARSVSPLALQRGQPLRNAARLLARPVRRIGLLGGRLARFCFCR